MPIFSSRSYLSYVSLITSHHIQDCVCKILWIRNTLSCLSPEMRGSPPSFQIRACGWVASCHGLPKKESLAWCIGEEIFLSAGTKCSTYPLRTMTIIQPNWEILFTSTVAPSHQKCGSFPTRPGALPLSPPSFVFYESLFSSLAIISEIG